MAEPIPVGVVVERDEGWPHAKALIERGDICAAASELTPAAFDPGTKLVK